MKDYFTYWNVVEEECFVDDQRIYSMRFEPDEWLLRLEPNGFYLEVCRFAEPGKRCGCGLGLFEYTPDGVAYLYLYDLPNPDTQIPINKIILRHNHRRLRLEIMG